MGSSHCGAVAGGMAQASLPCIGISYTCLEVGCAKAVSLGRLGECWARQALLLRYFSEPLKCPPCCEALKGLSEALPPCLFFSHCFMGPGRALGSAVPTTVGMRMSLWHVLALWRIPWGLLPHSSLGPLAVLSSGHGTLP